MPLATKIRIVTAISVMPESGDQLVRPMHSERIDAGHPDPQRAEHRHHGAAQRRSSPASTEWPMTSSTTNAPTTAT